VIVSDQLADMRKKERLRELFEQQVSVTCAVELTAIAESLAPIVGLDLQAALLCVTEFNRSQAAAG